MYALKLLFSMSGRMNRLTYILVSLVAGVLGMGLTVGLEFASIYNPKPSIGLTSTVIVLLGIYSQAAMLTKRIRDTGKSTSLVWVYYITLVLGLISFMIGFVLLFTGSFYLVPMLIGVLLLGVSFVITLIAIFARSAPTNNTSSLNGLASSDPMAIQGNSGDYNSDADAIIARALEKRRIADETRREDVLRPITRATNNVSPIQAGSGGFGRRNAPAFGNR